MAKTELEFEDFFVIRTPRQSRDYLYRAPESRAEYTEYLLEWLKDKKVKEALFIASPSLLERIESWKKKPNSKQGRKVEYALSKYMIRMCSRPTPFGLFSGVSLGTIGSNTSLIVKTPEQDSRKTRLDMLYLTHLKEYCIKNYQSTIEYRPNSSIYLVADECRYIEPYKVDGSYQYRLSAVQSNEYLKYILKEVKNGKTISSLAVSVVDKYADFSIEEVVDYIHSLIEESLLIASAPLPLTGEAPDSSLVKTLKEIGCEDVSRDLNSILNQLDRLDNSEVKDLDRYYEILNKLKNIPVKFKDNKIFQVDLCRSFHNCSIESSLMQSLMDVLVVLKALGHQDVNPFRNFIKEFNTRYEGQLVALDEILDDESGIGFSGETGYEASLIAGLNLKRSNYSKNVDTAISALEYEVIKAISLPANSNAEEVCLSSKELIKNFKVERIGSLLPASFAAMFGLYKNKLGNLMFNLNGFYGPSAASLLGRFGHLNNDLTNQLKEHLSREELHSPDVVFAEIAHMPEGRVGNIIARPHLREYEIVFMADSTLPKEKQIHISDLHVWVENGMVKLWSKRLKKRVIPRLSSAHNFGTRSLSAYRFLSMLQNQESQSPAFSLPKALKLSSFVPRIMIDNVIISPKKWRIYRKELEKVICNDGLIKSELDDLKIKYQLDNWVAFSKGDNVLQLSLGNVAMVKILLEETISLEVIDLTEVLASAYEPVVTSESGLKYSNEVIVPIFNPKAIPYRGEPDFSGETLKESPVIRRFNPGSEWMSFKIYAGNSAAEHFLVEQLKPVILKNRELFSKWFFIRYGDPDWHIRLRFNGEPKVLYSQLLLSLNEVLEPAVESGLIHKIELFTYQREVERYGGSLAIDLCESIFMEDSELILNTLKYTAELDDEVRWRVSLLAIDQMLTLFGYGDRDKLRLIDNLRAGFGVEFNENANLRKQLGNKYKLVNQKLRSDLLMFLNNSSQNYTEDNHIIYPLIENWINKVKPHVFKLKELLAEGKVTCTMDILLGSIFHMHNNRMFKAYGREHELVVYDFLRRFYFSESKRKEHLEIA